MTISDPISDMLTRIRNSIMAGHQTVSLPSSNMKLSIVKILQEEGFIKENAILTGKRYLKIIKKEQKHQDIINR